MSSVQWLRESLKISFLPVGSIASQLDELAQPRSPVNYRTDKPIEFNTFGITEGIEIAIHKSQYKEWLCFCYSPLPYYSRNSLFFNDVFKKTMGRLKLSKTAEKKMGSLTLLAALSARSQIAQAPCPIKGKEIAKLLNIKEQTWRAIWAPRYKAFIDDFKHHDESAVQDLSWILNPEKAS